MAAICRRIPNPTYMGYSVGKWEGDTLVVTTAGFNDKGWLDSAGHPQTESLRVTERYRRRDFGHMDFEITIEDPKVFNKPFTIKTQRLLQADTELLEDVCENEQSRARVHGRYQHQGESGRRGDLCRCVRAGAGPGDRDYGHRRPAVRARSERAEASADPEVRDEVHVDGDPAGFEFVKDGQGKVTHLIVRGNVPEQKAVRKSP